MAWYYPLLQRCQELEGASREYLQVLLQPYIDSLSRVPNVEELAIWCQRAFPAVEWDLTPDLDQSRTDIVDHLLARLLTGSKERYADGWVTPWDLHHAALTDPLLASLFQFPPEMELGIAVQVGPQTFPHTFAEETALGLAYWATIYEGVCPYRLLLHGQELQLPLDRLRKVANYRYTIELGGERVGFQTADFLGGLLTGAKWSKHDYREYLGAVREGERLMRMVV